MPNTLLSLILVFIFLFLQLVHRRNKTAKYGAPFVPLEPDVTERVLNFAEVKKGDVFYDLGSGDGRLVISAALKGAKAYGVEIDRMRVLYSRLWIFLLRLGCQATIIHKNIYDVDLSEADVITVYLLPETNNTLQEKLEKEVKQGTKIVGVAFDFPRWKPVKIDPRGPIYGPLYLYKMDRHKK